MRLLYEGAMANNGIAVISCRILSLYVLASALIGIGEPLGRFVSHPELYPIWPVATPLLLNISVSIILWVFADFIAKRMLGEANTKDEETNYSFKYAGLAFAVLGVYLIATAIPSIVRLTYWYISTYDSGYALGLNARSLIVGDIVKFVIGVLVFMRSGSLGRRFNLFAESESINPNK